jgi:hypothetical protein
MKNINEYGKWEFNGKAVLPESEKVKKKNTRVMNTFFAGLFVAFCFGLLLADTIKSVPLDYIITVAYLCFLGFAVFLIFLQFITEIRESNKFTKLETC